MMNRILLVDDEKIFLESLKDGLQTLSHIFETDICFSVNEALKLVLTKTYDIVITDIRMPQKSGIDLILHLRYIKYTGKVMVMSAYNTEESIKTIESLGVLEVISKPFKIDWLKNKLVSFFKNKVEDPVDFGSISLLTVMQVINLEKKTTAVQVEVDSTFGVIYFIDGEIINAEYKGTYGLEAVTKLVALNRGRISIKKIKERVIRKIRIPFEKLILETVNSIDESRANKSVAKKSESFASNKDTRHKLNLLLTGLKKIKGYVGAGFFSPQGGEIMDDNGVLLGVQMETFSTYVNDFWQNARKLIDAAGFGQDNVIQLETSRGIFFIRAVQKNDRAVFIMLIVNNMADAESSREAVTRVGNELKSIL